MKATRRGFLGMGAAVAAASLSGCGPTSTHSTTSTKPFVFDASAPLRVRKSFWDLTDAEVRTLCKAVGYVRNTYLPTDPRKWDNYASIHAKHCTGEAGTDPHGMLQVHWSWHFLPWHRGYLFFLERILAHALREQGLDDSTFAYPFWDWTVHQGMPNTSERQARNLASPLWGYDLTQENMVTADTLGFDNLALYNGNRGPSLEKSGMTPDNEVSVDSKAHIIEASHYMSPEYINLALRLPWEQFGGLSEIKRTSQGILEAGPHNDGHDWVGTRFGSNRDMGTLKFAALDPIFFMHHGNIDRIFSLYRGEMPDVNGPWGQQTYTYTDADGSDVTVSVKDIMTTLTNAVEYKIPSDNALVPAVPFKQTHMIWLNTAGRVNVVEQHASSQSRTITFDFTHDESIPHDLANSVALLEVQTGPLMRTGRSLIQVYIDDQYVGRIRMLDGIASSTDSTVNHTFTLTAHKFKELLGFVSNPRHFRLTLVAKNFTGPIEVRQIGLRFLQ